MDRVVLLALLALPVLVIMHVALFEQGLTSAVGLAWTPIPEARAERVSLQGYWRAPERKFAPPRYVINTSPEQGS